MKTPSKKKTGLAPGAIVYTGNYTNEKVFVHYLKYDTKQYNESTHDTHSKITFNPAEEENVDWYDIRGMSDIQLIESLGSAFNIHPIVLENAVDVNQRAYYDEYENGNFITLKAISFDATEGKIHKEHVAIYFRKGIIITLQEKNSDLFSAVRNRIKNSNGRIRQRGTDYLAYALADVIVDNYFVVLEQIEEEIEMLEEAINLDQQTQQKSNIHRLKRELLVLRKSIAPLREAINRFSKSESPRIEEKTIAYIRNLYDHTIQVMDALESYRDMLNSLQDVFIAEVSFKMNKVMQLLTLISVIFIPLTFLAGIYGMNFENIPELHYKYGYHILLIVMFVIAVALLIIFRRKKWL